MSIQRVTSGVSWEEDFAYSRAVRVGDRILVSGTTATGPAGPVHTGDAAAQARYALGKVRAAIESLGGSLTDVVRTRIYVKPGADWEAVARVHGEAFRDAPPACTLVFAHLIGEEYLVEVEAEAVVSA